MSSHTQQLTDHYRALLRAHEAHSAHAIEAAYGQARTSIQPQLDELREEMLSTPQDSKIPLIWLYQNQRMERIKQSIAEQIKHFAQMAKGLVDRAKKAAVQLAQQFAWALLSESVPGRSRPNDVIATAQDASELAGLFDGLDREAAEEAGKALIAGVTLGRDPREIAKDIQDALGTSRNRALTINRDQINTAYRRALLDLYNANSDIVEGWIWNAIRDAHTCIVCILMNGTFHPLSEPFEGHVGDRCTPIPKIRDAIPDQIQPGTDWFDRQPVTVQRQILGPVKLAAYQDGTITLLDLIKHGYDPRWGGYRQEKSLREAIGARKAARYYGK